MNAVANVMKIHVKDKWSWLFIPWMILLFSFVVNLIIGTLTGGQIPIYTGGISSIYVAMLIIGAVILVQLFPFAVGLNIRRTDFFLGTIAMSLAFSAGSSVLLFLLAETEQWTGAWGVNLHFFHLPYLNDGAAMEQMLIYFALMLNMIYVGFTVASAFRRFGRIGLLILFGLVLLVGSASSFLITYNQWWLAIFYWLRDHTAFTLAMWTVPLTAVCILASYFMLRKATV